MIRAATPADLPRVRELVHDMHAASKYFGRVDISHKALDDLLLTALGNCRRNIDGGTHFNVSERKGAVTGFMIGILSRVYFIGNRLVAQDMFLNVAKSGSASDVLGLIDGYVAWASANPKVMTINLSWNDTLPGAERIVHVYRRKGFLRTGGIYEMAVDRPALREAA